MIANREIGRQKQRLDDIFQKTHAATNQDAEIQAHWAKYLTVLTAGLLENAISEVYKDYVGASSNPRVAKYASSVLDRIQNPKCDRFVEVARAFDSSWAEALITYTSSNGTKEAIDSIMNERNHIAHGKDSSISLARIREYYDASLKVIEFIENQCRSMSNSVPG
jgi:hypothetical protein